ncbi:MAG TPA: TlpA family protein disulfide reductase [Candidatus Hydrogenedentes bacterium]|nr:TlpA family protein disulfide reductase [Candidatus Hydrogenedentota bacterium]
MTHTDSDNTNNAARNERVRRAFFGNRLFIAAFIGVALWFGGNALLHRNSLEGKPAPVFSGTMLDGGIFALEEHLGKQPVLLDFWAVWCPPCREALPKVAAAAVAHADNGLVVCAVNLKETPDTVHAFLQGRGLELPVLLDSDGAVAAKYGVKAIPMLVFINRAGNVNRVHVGAMSKEELDEALAAIL